MDLTDPAVRADLVERLAGLYAGGPVILGPGVLAAFTSTVAELRGRGCRVLVLSTARGAGPVPGPDECTVVELETPTTRLVTDELRLLDHLAHHLPDHAVAAIERFDPAGEAIWNTGHFVADDEPILGRRVVGGRPAAYFRMEDKLFAEEVWAACNVPTAPHLVVPVEETALAEATAALAGPLGAVWTGDTRDGFHGAGNYVRWVADEADLAVAQSFFALHCDRVRVMPFLDGVPCSIHGFVLPDGTAALRPVEIVVLRKVASHEFVYGGLSSYWDPPDADRAEMRAIARRVGNWLQAEHDYRGAFGIDGVLTADGFRPTELNTRLPAGAVRLADVDRELFDPPPDPSRRRARHRGDRRGPRGAGPADGCRAGRSARRDRTGRVARDLRRVRPRVGRHHAHQGPREDREHPGPRGHAVRFLLEDLAVRGARSRRPAGSGQRGAAGLPRP